VNCVAQPGDVTLLPGDVAVGSRGDRLQTLLGSCVAIVLTDPRRTLGVMCHIVHSGPASGHSGDDTAFADVALRRMRELLQARGIVPQLCDAYVYGGGDMFPQLDPPLGVGDDNAVWAVSALRAMGVRILATDLGGAVYRRLKWTVGPDEPQVSVVSIEGGS
jgi:chemotaxis protein CheD